MQSTAKTPLDYLVSLPEDRQVPMDKLVKVIRKNLPKGFAEGMGYGMMGWSVPHSRYPAGYHCKPSDPLPFLGLASQKNFIALYHMGVYADPKLYKWFTDEYKKRCKSKLDMGKSCLRLSKMDDIPYELIGELVSKITVDQWIAMYESAFKKGKEAKAAKTTKPAKTAKPAKDAVKKKPLKKTTKAKKK